MNEEEQQQREREELESRGLGNGNEQITPLVAPTPGTVIAASVTIDALFTSVFGTRSADLVAAGTPVYSWNTPNSIIAQWPTIQVGSSPVVPNYSCIVARFESRSNMGSSIAQ